MAGYAGRGLHASIVEAIGSRIVAGELSAGDVLDLAALGTELDISKTALREALQVLRSKGLVDARQKRGTFVRPRGSWDVLDSDVIRWHRSTGGLRTLLTHLAEVRSIIEPAAAALAARRRTDHDVEELRRGIAAMRAAVGGPAADATAADLQWHGALLRATHNEMLARMETFIEPALFLRDSVVHDHHPDDPVPSHELVTEAVIAQDADAAARAAADLLAKASDDLGSVLDADRPEAVPE